jgi:hypothetical protein
LMAIRTAAPTNSADATHSCVPLPAAAAKTAPEAASTNAHATVVSAKRLAPATRRFSRAVTKFPVVVVHGIEEAPAGFRLLATRWRLGEFPPDPRDQLPLRRLRRCPLLRWVRRGAHESEITTRRCEMKRASYATLTPHGPPGAAPASCARPQRLGPGEGTWLEGVGGRRPRQLA